MLEIINADCGYTGKKNNNKQIVLKGISFTVKKGKILCILGANGVGKTTLFKTILGALPLLGGKINIDGIDMKEFSKREHATKIGYVPQSHIPAFPYTVFDIVLMGRTAYVTLSSSPSKHDVEIVNESLEVMGISKLSDKVYTEISGGERQLVLIARALAQQPQYLLLDEPTSNLDLGNQTRVLRQLKNLEKLGMGIIFTTHNPNHAFLCQTDTVIVKDEQNIKIGAAHEIISKELMRSIYNIDSEVITIKNNMEEQMKAVIPFI